MPAPDAVDNSSYIKEIQGMMYGFGDSNEPLKETAELVERILKSQLIQFINLLSETAMKIESRKVGVNEFLILLRHNPVKLRRFCKYLQVADLKKLADIADSEQLPPDELEVSSLQAQSKGLKGALAFLQHLDPSGYLVSVADPTRPSPLLDESLMERNQRIEMMTTAMDIDQYLNYSKAKAYSFRRNQPSSKFQDWLLRESQSPDVTMSNKAWAILSYFAYETVAQLVDLAFIVRRDNEAYKVADAVERNAATRVSPSNADLNKPTWSNSMKPLQVEEIMEAMRRYNARRSSSSPFSRSGAIPPAQRLLGL